MLLPGASQVPVWWQCPLRGKRKGSWPPRKTPRVCRSFESVLPAQAPEQWGPSFAAPILLGFMPFLQCSRCVESFCLNPSLIRRKEKQERRGTGGERGRHRNRDEKRRELDEEDRRCKEILRAGWVMRKASLLTVRESCLGQLCHAGLTYLCIYFPLCKIQNCLLQRKQ